MNYPTDRMQYIDMEDLYKPKVVYFDGMNGLGAESWWNTIFGKGQAWFDRVNEIGNQLTILLAEIGAFGEPLWDAIGKTARVTAGAPPAFPGYADAMNLLQTSAASVIVTKGRTPSDAAIDAADVTSKTYRSFVEFAKKVAPEVKSLVEGEAAKMAEIVAGSTLHSPADVGKKAFEEELEKRAKVLGVGIGIGTMAIMGLAIFAILAKERFMKNPRRKRRSSGTDYKQLAIYGGIGYLAYDYWTKK